jgi:hypothetical protein
MVIRATNSLSQHDERHFDAETPLKVILGSKTKTADESEFHFQGNHSIEELESKLKRATESISEIMLALQDASEVREQEDMSQTRGDFNEKRVSEPAPLLQQLSLGTDDAGRLDRIPEQYDNKEKKVKRLYENDKLNQREDESLLVIESRGGSNQGLSPKEKSNVQITTKLVVEAKITRSDTNHYLGMKVISHKRKEGIFISSIEESSPLALTAIQPGMRITEINGLACPTKIPEMIKILQESRKQLTIQAMTEDASLMQTQTNFEKSSKVIFENLFSCGGNITNAFDTLLYFSFDFYRTSNVDETNA